MSNLHNLTLSRPSILRAVCLPVLHEFLKPFADYFKQRGLNLNTLTEENEIGFARLSGTKMMFSTSLTNRNFININPPMGFGYL